MNDVARRYYDLEARLTAQVSERMLDLADVRPGSRVLDVATGRGEPLLRAARRVGERGRVLGVDLDAGALGDVRAAAAAEGLAHVEVRVADAEELDAGEGAFDAATARWGLMYMARPERALRAVHRALVPGGALVAAFWAEPERVSWARLPREVTARFTPVPPLDPRARGAFRYAAPSAIEADLAAAGFRVERVEEHDVAVVEAETGEGIAAWADGVLGRMAAALDDPGRAAWRAAIAREAEALRDGATIRLGGVTRLVLARRDARGAQARG